MVKRAEVLRKIRAAARAAGVEMTEQELTNHTGITVGGICTTVSRSTGDFGRMAETIFKQLEPALGKGWWRR
jgi:hypothetical protein